VFASQKLKGEIECLIHGSFDSKEEFDRRIFYSLFSILGVGSLVRPVISQEDFPQML